jgi:hypothetical protein
MNLYQAAVEDPILAMGEFICYGKYRAEAFFAQQTLRLCSKRGKENEAMQNNKYVIPNMVWALFLCVLGVVVIMPAWSFFPFNFMLVALNLIDYGIHEMGHMVLGLSGIIFIGMLGGSLFQWGGPLLMMSYSFYKKRFTTAYFFLFWFGKSLNESVPYIRDARSQALPLISPFFFTGEPVTHDWNYLLGQLHLLQADQAIAGMFWVAGTLVMLAAIFLTAVPAVVIRGWVGRYWNAVDSQKIPPQGIGG